METLDHLPMTQQTAVFNPLGSLIGYVRASPEGCDFLPNTKAFPAPNASERLRMDVLGNVWQEANPLPVGTASGDLPEGDEPNQFAVYDELGRLAAHIVDDADAWAWTPVERVQSLNASISGTTVYVDSEGSPIPIGEILPSPDAPAVRVYDALGNLTGEWRGGERIGLFSPYCPDFLIAEFPNSRQSFPARRLLPDDIELLPLPLGHATGGIVTNNEGNPLGWLAQTEQGNRLVFFAARTPGELPVDWREDGQVFYKGASIGSAPTWTKLFTEWPCNESSDDGAASDGPPELSLGLFGEADPSGLAETQEGFVPLAGWYDLIPPPPPQPPESGQQWQPR